MVLPPFVCPVKPFPTSACTLCVLKITNTVNTPSINIVQGLYTGRHSCCILSMVTPAPFIRRPVYICNTNSTWTSRISSRSSTVPVLPAGQTISVNQVPHPNIRVSSPHCGPAIYATILVPPYIDDVHASGTSASPHGQPQPSIGGNHGGH